ncbi:Txe/YoeB family addiction module toxin [Desulfovibrio sp. JC010]|uniref:Txe/YoeB family addiction module toxin n=1 Tax=Desulfovibrio sp. JC010 TaxID=2593641 RepID=UPI0013D7891A|nr:Txe/YoeB family addiction module toxin [Desulfovibrio sp. JC010]NDV27641.1 Txe/YoeB family addiction module toxin [Desulfovibrio sp. JC010]
MPQISWTELAWDDYLYWQKNDKKALKRINALIKNSLRSPFEGMGKPEALRFDLTGYWSRRINREHRLVYKYDDKSDALIIIQCRHHY